MSDCSGWTIGQCATVACVLEATAPKPGNVHRGADFDDVGYLDFLLSAVAIAPAMEGAEQAGVGPTVLAAIEATRRVVRTNTNLGIVLLLGPLAAIPRASAAAEGVRDVLAALGSSDAEQVYRAIRLARPGGLGDAAEHDVHGQPPPCLLTAMRHAADRDGVARQYANGYADVIATALPALIDELSRGAPMLDAIVRAHLVMMEALPDTLIARKCGVDVARSASVRAGAVLASGGVGDTAYCEALADFDFWLRSDHHRRNPGTTADLVTAALFIALREGQITWPLPG